MRCLNTQRLVLALVSVGWLIGCDGYTKVSGVVLDQNARPVSGAEVSLRYHGREDTSDAIGHDETTENGQFEVSGSHAPGSEPIDFEVIHERFVPHSSTVAPNEEHRNVTVQLKAAGEGGRE
jgi:hypothetical protein